MWGALRLFLFFSLHNGSVVLCLGPAGSGFSAIPSCFVTTLVKAGGQRQRQSHLLGIFIAPRKLGRMCVS